MKFEDIKEWIVEKGYARPNNPYEETISQKVKQPKDYIINLWENINNPKFMNYETDSYAHYYATDAPNGCWESEMFEPLKTQLRWGTEWIDITHSGDTDEIKRKFLSFKHDKLREFEILNEASLIYTDDFESSLIFEKGAEWQKQRSYSREEVILLMDVLRTECAEESVKWSGTDASRQALLLINIGNRLTK